MTKRARLQIQVSGIHLLQTAQPSNGVRNSDIREATYLWHWSQWMDKQLKCNIFVFNLLLYTQYVFHVYYFVHVYMGTAKSEAADHARVYLHSLNTHPFLYTYQSIHPSIHQSMATRSLCFKWLCGSHPQHQYQKVNYVSNNQLTYKCSLLCLLFLALFGCWLQNDLPSWGYLRLASLIKSQQWGDKNLWFLDRHAETCISWSPMWSSSDLTPLDLLTKALPSPGQDPHIQVGNSKQRRSKSIVKPYLFRKDFNQVHFQSVADSPVHGVQRTTIVWRIDDITQFSCIPNLHQLWLLPCWVLTGCHN